MGVRVKEGSKEKASGQKGMEGLQRKPTQDPHTIVWGPKCYTSSLNGPISEL